MTSGRSARSPEASPGPGEKSGVEFIHRAASWRGWFGDTLFKRLFVLMWVALVASHLLAYTVMHSVNAPPDRPAQSAAPPLPVLPSLPPMMATSRQAPPGDAPPPPPDGMRSTGPPPADEPGGMMGPMPLMWLDYLVRFVAIGVAAWFGARWLSAPIRKLAAASDDLGHALKEGRPPPVLDAESGTLEVRQTAQVFNAMAQRLRRQFDAQSLLMAAISHDLRTPLARLRLRLETMDELSAADSLAKRCVADVREMDTLIGGVLDMMREGHARGGRERVDMAALVQSLVDDLAEQHHPAHVASSVPEAIVLSQPAALRRVLGNLLGNALRHGGSAAVTVCTSDDDVQVLVEDVGPGIPVDQLEAVFEPFYRLDASRSRDTGGTGLGLYVARDLAQRNGGHLTLANRPEGGLRARLTMPRAGDDP
jgi:signal transduction histidine kinase